MSEQDKLISVLEEMTRKIEDIKEELSSIKEKLRVLDDTIHYWLGEIDKSINSLKETEE